MEGFRFSLGHTVQAADVNHRGHLSNAAVVELLQTARLAYFTRVAPWVGGDQPGDFGFIIPELTVRYRSELLVGDSLEIGVRVDELRNRSFTMSYLAAKEAGTAVSATMSVVCFDYAERRAAPIPQRIRDAVSGFEGIPAFCSRASADEAPGQAVAER